MRTLPIALVAALVVLAAVAPATAAGQVTATDVECEYPLELTDGTGEELTVEEAPERVVTLMPSDAQTAFGIGADDAVVGMPVGPATEDLEVDDQTDITEDDGFTVDVETVVSLEPDVVIAASAADPQLVHQLRDLDIEVYQFADEESIDDVLDNVALTGALTGECDGAEETIDWMDERLDLLESAVEDEEQPLVYYEMGEGFSAGTGTFQHELIRTAGLENLAEVVGVEGWGVVSEEDVLEEDPDWLLYGDDWPEEPFAESVEETSAYQDGNVIVVDSNDFSQPGPNVVFAVEELVEAVHQDAYEGISDELADLDAAYEDGEQAADDAGAADDGDDTADDAGAADDGDDEIPGFGVPVAVASLLVTAGVLLRRR